jgi:hypothetical protein
MEMEAFFPFALVVPRGTVNFQKKFLSLFSPEFTVVHVLAYSVL